MVPNRQKRNSLGLGSLELAVGALFIVIMLMVSIDLSMMMLANATVDRAARDAARAAAQQDNATRAAKAARAILSSHRTDGYWLTQPKLTSTNAPDFVYQDYGGNPLVGNPSVTVTTVCTAKLPVPIDFLGQTLTTAGSSGPGTLDFRRSYTFPIIRFKLSPAFQ